MMTTLTTLLGMMPLAIGDAQVGGAGDGSPAYYPMARAIIGGLAFSSVVSLLIVPMFYVWFDDLNLWRQRVFGRAADARRRCAARRSGRRTRRALLLSEAFASPARGGALRAACRREARTIRRRGCLSLRGRGRVTYQSCST